MELLRRAILLSAFFCAVHAFSMGPPGIADMTPAPANYMGLTRGQLVCERLTPGHFAEIAGTPSDTAPNPQQGNGGYFIISDLIDDLNGQYIAGDSYSLQLTGTTNNFLGFLIQARDDSGTPIGTFTPLDTGRSQTLNCDSVSPQATVTHSNLARVLITSLNFTWQAPPDNNGSVTFFYSVVQVFPVYFVSIDSSAPENRPPSGTLPTTEPTEPPTEFDVPVFTIPPDAPTTAPEDYNVRFRRPSGCSVPSCDYYMGIQMNENNTFLDFYLQADANGWVAVGFSGSSNMFDADVVGCQVLSGDNTVFPVNTWNPGFRTNQFDPVQNGTFLHSSSFENGRITCNFSRFVGVVNPGLDLDLNERWFFMFGVGEDAADNELSAFSQHQVTPVRSDGRHRPNTTEDIEIEEDTLRAMLIRAHGILMIAAWPMLAVTAIFFAAWMRPALPNGEWFQVHRALMLASVFVAAVGFILVFIAHIDNPTPGLIELMNRPDSQAHFAIGIIVMAFHIANPIISIFRCKPSGKYRWIFNILHGTMIGLLAELLALTNCGIGLSIFGVEWSIYLDLTVFWVYIGWLSAFLVLVGILFVMFTIIAFLTPQDGAKLAPSVLKPLVSVTESTGKVEVEMSQTGEHDPVKSEPDPKARKPASKDAPLRWIALGVFVAITLPMTVTLIVLVALEED